MTNTPITAALLSEALSFIPASLPRDEWARVGMAIKSEFPNDTGWNLFRDWSASDAASFDAPSAWSTWRSIKPTGGVSVSTLLYLAQQHGFKLPRRSRGPLHATKPFTKDKTQSIAELDAHQKAEHAAVAEQAAAMWDAASPTGKALICNAKGCRALACAIQRMALCWCLCVMHRGYFGMCNA